MTKSLLIKVSKYP